MGARNRNRTLRYQAGGVKETRLKADNSLLTYVAGYSGATDYEVCGDTTMSPPYNVDHGLSIEKDTADPLEINGEVEIGNYRYVYRGFRPLNRSRASVYCASLPAVNPSYYMTKALANMNPDKPEVDLPEFIHELKDIPGMLRQAGRVLTGRIHKSDIPGSYVSYYFGWAPLLKDLAALWNLQEAITKRISYLRKLENGTRIRRQLGSSSSTVVLGNFDEVVAGSTYAYRGIRIADKQQKAWYTANAKLTTPLPSGPGALERQAMKSVLGLKLGVPATIWETIPWSWLVDYLVNVGDVLDAQRNSIPFACSRMNVMITSTVVDRITFYEKHRNLSVSGGVLRRTAKWRSCFTNPTPVLTYRPLWTNHMSGILASIGGARLLSGSKKP